jgi:hypothetical protein
VRKLTEFERGVLDRMLENDFPGRDELRAQIESADVSEFEGDDSGSLRFQVTGPRVVSPHQVLVEARAYDRDGVPIDYLIHVVDGFIFSLEVVKADMSSIIQTPELASLEVYIH